MCTMDCTHYQFPHWSEKPPATYPFEQNLWDASKQPQLLQEKPFATSSDLQAIHDCGNRLLESEENIDALWKFENCFLICKQNKQTTGQVNYASICIMVAVKLYSSTQAHLQKDQLSSFWDKYCNECFTLVPEKSPQRATAHYWKGEGFRLQNKNKDALGQFIESYRCDQGPSALSKIILLKGAKAKELLNSFNFKKNLVELLQILLVSDKLSTVHIKLLLKFSMQTAEFRYYAKRIPCEVGEKLLRFCQEKRQLLQEVIALLSYPEEQIFLFIRNQEDDQFCCHLVDTEQFCGSSELMSKLTAESRTQYICELLKSGKEIRQAIKMLSSGEIKPDFINLSALGKSILLSTELLSALLHRNVNPCGLPKWVTPITQLVKACPNKVDAKSKALLFKTVTSIMLLLEAGADVEDLTAYHTGETTPLHVAAELALLTGEMDILKMVRAKWQGDPSSTDEKRRTVLHVIATSSHKYIKNPSRILNLWEYLVQKCKVDMSIGDISDNRIASCYLPREIRKQLVDRGIPCQLPEVPQLKLSTEMAISSNQEKQSPTPHKPNKLLSQENGAPTAKAGAHQQAKQAKTAIASHKKKILEEVKSAIASSNTKPNESQTKETSTSEKFKENYTEDKVENVFEQLLSSKPDTYFVSRELEVNASQDLSQNTAMEGNVVEKQKIDTVQLPLKLDSKRTLWEVEYSEHFCKQLNSESVCWKSVLSTIQKLEEGHFDSDTSKKLKVGHSIPGQALFEARVNDTFRLVYILRDRFSERDTKIVEATIKKSICVYKKTIIIWSLVTNHKRINHEAKLALRTIKDQSYKGLDILEGEVGLHKGCLLPQVSLDCKCDKITDEEKARIKLLLNISTNLQEGRRTEHVGAKTYSLTMSAILELLDEKSEKGDYPIKVADDEFDIIEKSSKQPVVVLGRSGTGKTTVCLCRLWKRFTKYWNSEDRHDNPLIPNGRYLRFEDLKEDLTQVIDNDEPFTDLTSGNHFHDTQNLESNTDTTEISTAYDDQIHQIQGEKETTLSNKCSCDTEYKAHSDTCYGEEIPPAVAGGFGQKWNETKCSSDSNNLCHDTNTVETSPSDEYEHIHQVFITKSGKLCEQLKQQFYKLMVGYRHAQKHKEFIDNLKTQPQSLLGIKELCYPLFLTARQFFLMLDKSLGDGQNYFQENEVVISSEQPMSSKLETLHEVWNKEENSDDPKQLKRVEVTASYFQRHIWPNLNAKKHFKRGKVDPNLVWMEIQSFIKGSLKALESGGTLSLKDYEEFGKKRAPNFPMNRAEIYRLFEEYNKALKHKNIDRRLFDNGDFIYKLHTRMKCSPYERSWSIHYVYIDEVQDFTQAELSVIVRCCKHSNGFFFAGDTAQTIIRGIAFRFEDLTSIFHFNKKELEQKIVVNLPEKSLLTLNHRSHCGITSLATTVTDLLQHFFRNSFDWEHIPKDDSKMDGPVPLFLCGILRDEFLNLKMGSDSKDSVQFGADQVVIVREKGIIANLPHFLREAIVLTVQQCKGLEFNDVLLYNFFTDFVKEADTVTREIWRASAEYLEDNPNLSINEPFKDIYVHPLKFDERRHKTLCSELKYLYTVITRAKSHLWIFESSIDDALPMIDYWHRRNVVKVVTDLSSYTDVNEQLEEVATNASEGAKWKTRGDELSEKELWEQAAKCYQKANEPLLEKKTRIQILHREAATIKDKRLYRANQRETAVTHLECDKFQHDVQHLLSAAICLYSAGMYLTSAKLFEKLQEFNKALESYDKAKDVHSYTRLKERLEDYQGAISYAFEHKQFDIGLQLAIRFEKQEKVQQAELAVIANETISKLLLMDKINEVRKWLMFIPDQQQLLDTKKHDCRYREAFGILCAQNKFSEAFRLARAQNLFNEAIKVAENPCKLSMFQLQQASYEILRMNCVKNAEVIRALEVLTKGKDAEVAAKAKFFLAMDQNRKNGTILCREAYDTYKQEGNAVGEIECIHIILLRNTIQKLSILIEQTISMVSTAKKLTDVMSKWPQIEGNEIQVVEHIETFYGFESNEKRLIAKSKYYFIPKTKYLWISSHVKQTKLQYDSDGMVRLHQEKALMVVRSHIEGYTSGWLRTAQAKLQKAFEHNFEFHREIKRQGYLRPQQPLPKGFNISHYMELCELESKLHRVHNEIEDPVTVVFDLLSPFSQLLIHLKREDYERVASLYLAETLKTKVKTALKVEDKPNCDRWLEAWRILLITATDQSGEQTDSILEVYQAENMIPPYSIWDTLLQKDRHYFSYWLDSCKFLESGRTALFAIKISTENFIQYAANNSTAENMSISMENLISILSVHTSALLIMLSHSYAKQNQQERIIPVPETFQRFMEDFHLISCYGKSNIGIQMACCETAKAIGPDIIQMEVSSLLVQFLKILIGEFRQNFNPWKIAITKSQLQSGDTLHCLVLTLTILGNLVLLCDTSLVSFLQESYLKMLKHISNPTVTISKYLKNAYRNMQKCVTTKDLFQNVLSNLLSDSIGMNVTQLKIAEQEEPEQVVFTECQCEKIPEISIRLQDTLQENTQQQPVSSISNSDYAGATDNVVSNAYISEPNREKFEASFTGLTYASAVTSQEQIASASAPTYAGVVTTHRHSSKIPGPSSIATQQEQTSVFVGVVAPRGHVSNNKISYTSALTSKGSISEPTFQEGVTLFRHLPSSNATTISAVSLQKQTENSPHFLSGITTLEENKSHIPAPTNVGIVECISRSQKPAASTSKPTYAGAVASKVPTTGVHLRRVTPPPGYTIANARPLRASSSEEFATGASGSTFTKTLALQQHVTTPTSGESLPSHEHFKLPPNITRVVTPLKPEEHISNTRAQVNNISASQQEVASQKPMAVTYYAGAIASKELRSNMSEPQSVPLSSLLSHSSLTSGPARPVPLEQEQTTNVSEPTREDVTVPRLINARAVTPQEDATGVPVPTSTEVPSQEHTLPTITHPTRHKVVTSPKLDTHVPYSRQSKVRLVDFPGTWQAENQQRPASYVGAVASQTLKSNVSKNLAVSSKEYVPDRVSHTSRHGVRDPQPTNIKPMTSLVQLKHRKSNSAQPTRVVASPELATANVSRATHARAAWSDTVSDTLGPPQVKSVGSMSRPRHSGTIMLQEQTVSDASRPQPSLFPRHVSVMPRPANTAPLQQEKKTYVTQHSKTFEGHMPDISTHTKAQEYDTSVSGSSSVDSEAVPSLQEHLQPNTAPLRPKVQISPETVTIHVPAPSCARAVLHTPETPQTVPTQTPTAPVSKLWPTNENVVFSQKNASGLCGPTGPLRQATISSGPPRVVTNSERIVAGAQTEPITPPSRFSYTETERQESTFTRPLRKLLSKL